MLNFKSRRHPFNEILEVFLKKQFSMSKKSWCLIEFLPYFETIMKQKVKKRNRYREKQTDRGEKDKHKESDN